MTQDFLLVLTPSESEVVLARLATSKLSDSRRQQLLKFGDQARKASARPLPSLKDNVERTKII